MLGVISLFWSEKLTVSQQEIGLPWWLLWFSWTAVYRPTVGLLRLGIYSERNSLISQCFSWHWWLMYQLVVFLPVYLLPHPARTKRPTEHSHFTIKMRATPLFWRLIGYWSCSVLNVGDVGCWIMLTRVVYKTNEQNALGIYNILWVELFSYRLGL